MPCIVVIGSVARDEVIKLSEPLREGAHLEGECRAARLGGGAACTAVPLAYAGHEVHVVGSIGTDALGGELLDELAATGVDVSQILTVDQQSTRSMILVDGSGERTIVNVNRSHEPDPPVRVLPLPANCIYVRSRRPDLASLLGQKISDTLVIAHMPPCEAGSRPAHVLVASASDVDRNVLFDPLEAGRKVAGDALQWVLVTYGSQGVVAYSRDRTLRTPARRVNPIDTTGAGDTFAAGLVHGLVSGFAMEDALEMAVVWGAEATQYESSILPRTAVEKLL